MPSPTVLESASRRRLVPLVSPNRRLPAPTTAGKDHQAQLVDEVVLEKLGATNRTQAVTRARGLGVIPLERAGLVEDSTLRGAFG
jgi:hypothetical protein